MESDLYRFFIMKRNLRKQNRTENKAVESDLLGFIRSKLRKPYEPNVP